MYCHWLSKEQLLDLIKTHQLGYKKTWFNVLIKERFTVLSYLKAVNEAELLEKESKQMGKKKLSDKALSVKLNKHCKKLHTRIKIPVGSVCNRGIDR